MQPSEGENSEINETGSVWQSKKIRRNKVEKIRRSIIIKSYIEKAKKEEK